MLCLMSLLLTTIMIGYSVADLRVREYVRNKLTLGWNPEQIAGRIGFDMPDKRISYETIYLYVVKVERELTRYLTCERKNRRKRSRRPQRLTRLPPTRPVPSPPERSASHKRLPTKAGSRSRRSLGARASPHARRSLLLPPAVWPRSSAAAPSRHSPPPPHVLSSASLTRIDPFSRMIGGREYIRPGGAWESQAERAAVTLPTPKT